MRYLIKYYIDHYTFGRAQPIPIDSYYINLTINPTIAIKISITSGQYKLEITRNSKKMKVVRFHIDDYIPLTF